MDNETFQLLAKFIIKTRKIVGAVDSSKLVNEPIYAAGVFDKVEAVADEELMMLSLALRQQLGLLQKVATPLSAAVAAKPVSDNKPASADGNAKYKLGARS